MKYKQLLVLFFFSATVVSSAQTGVAEQAGATPQFGSFDQLGVDAWWQMVEAQPAAEQAWLNLYLAERFERWGNEEKELSNKDKSALQDVQTGIEFNVPNSFADHYIRFINSNFKDLEALKLAEYSRADDPLVLKARVDYESIYGSRINVRKGILHWGSIVNPSEALLSYSKNLLLSLPLNALVMTNGDDDTYPLLYLQEAQNFRKDVRIIQIDLLSSNEYRSRVAEMLNCSANALSGASRKAAFESVLNADQQKKVHIPFSLPGKWIKSQTVNYSVRGLCLEATQLAHTQAENSLLVLWETMDKSFIQSSNQFARNYIPMLIRLYQNPAITADKKKSVLAYIKDLASVTPNPDVILNLIGE